MRFADITGQEDLKRHLVQSVDAGRVSHAQLFTGQAGAGALALAVAYVQYLCCHHRHDGDSCGECPVFPFSLAGERLECQLWKQMKNDSH